EELYKKLCISFCEDHGDDPEKIKNALEGGDITTAHRLAHTLKSAAGLLGAEKVRRPAGEIEDALADSGGEKNLNAALGKLTDLEHEMKNLLAFLVREGLGGGAGGSAVDGASPETAEKAPDLQGIKSLCGKLLPMVKSGNTGSLECIPEIKECFRSLDGAGEILVKQIEDFDFSAALQTLLRIKQETEDRISKGR
ncbi:MAG: Hpt domain-containing protein, partial [Treponema sp.]|nr:Hpt domain-containing protein [Treponema sp.]